MLKVEVLGVMLGWFTWSEDVFLWYDGSWAFSEVGGHFICVQVDERLSHSVLTLFWTQCLSMMDSLLDSMLVSNRSVSLLIFTLDTCLWLTVYSSWSHYWTQCWTQIGLTVLSSWWFHCWSGWILMLLSLLDSYWSHYWTHVGLSHYRLASLNAYAGLTIGLNIGLLLGLIL